jgi:PAS domain S-box-containing protein
MVKKVLIVDDNSTNLYMLETLLKGYGFEVISAENGEDALDKAILNPPDLIVTDILMPVMDGYALCREWKADDTLKHIPLVFYTATYTGSKNEDFALSLGAERFIIKPQEPDKLMNILKEVLEENYVVKQVATKPFEEEMEFFRQYNEILFSKLEKKMLDLEIVNQKLRISEECYRLSFKNASDVIYTMDTDLNIISISPSVEKILGYKPQDFIGRPVSDLGHILTPESFKQAIADISLVLKGDTIAATVYRFIAKDGTIKYGEVSGSPMMREGKIIGIISVARDITDRKRAEEALRTLTSRQEAILAAVPEIIMEVDNNKVYIWANSVGIEFFGEDVIGKEAAFFFEGEQETYDTVRPLFSGADDIIYLESWQRRKDGEKRLLAWWCRVLKDESGQVTGALSSARDITERRQAEESLHESEKKYRELYDFLPIPVYEMDLEANITSANRAIYETFRGTEEDLKKGFKVWQLLSPEDIDKSSKNIQGLLKGEQIRGTEYTLMRLDGSVFPAIVISSVIYSDGKPVGLRGAIIDITERRHREQELRRVTTFLDSIVENIPDMIFVKDAGDLRFVRFNRAGENLLGYSRDDLLEKNDYDFFSKEQADFFTEKDRNVLHGKEVVDIAEEPIQTQKKGERILHTKKVPILDANGEPEYLLGISEDITDRKRAEEALRESEERLSKAQKISHVGSWELDLLTNRLIWSDEVYRIFGSQPQEFVATYEAFLDSIHPDDRNAVDAAYSSSLREGRDSYELEHRVVRKHTHDVRYVHERCEHVRDTSGRIVRSVGMVQDITDRKQAEEQLKHTLDSLRKALGTTIQVMVSAVETRDPYTAGHQIRSADLARAIATEMGLPQEKIDGIRMAGSIHDIGKLSIPAEILSKPTKLRNIEFSLIKEHSQKGYEMLKDVESPWSLAEIVYQHHERMDGSGYPRNLKGEDILMEARILAVADVVEAMASHRPYRPGLGIDAALEEIEKNRGTHYDNTVADACLRLFREKGFQLEGI